MSLDHQSFTGAHSYMASNEDVIAVVEAIEKQLKAGKPQPDPGDGWGYRIVVNVTIPEWMLSYIETQYAKNGWTITDRGDQVFFMIPDFNTFAKA